MAKSKTPQQIYGTGKAPLTGQTKVVGKKNVMKQQVKVVGKSVGKTPMEIMYDETKSLYNNLQAVYKELLQTTVDKKMFEQYVSEQQSYVNTLTTELNAKDEAIATEKKNVELLKQQIQNKDAYINRLHSGMAILTLQALKL